MPSGQIEHVGPTGIYPVSGPLPQGPAEVRGQGELAHPEERLRSKDDTRRRSTEETMLLIGRAIFGAYFLYNGINHFVNREMLTDYARNKQVFQPGVAVAVSGALLLLGGFSLLVGYRPKIGAALITTFLAGVSPKMHDFWRIEDDEQRMHEMVNFTKNMALIGGAALAAAVPEPWPARIRLHQRPHDDASRRAIEGVRSMPAVSHRPPAR